MSMSNSIENKNEPNLDEILESSFSELNKNLDELGENLKNTKEEGTEQEGQEDQDDCIELSFDEIIPIINQKYMNAISNLNSLFKHHKDLGPSIKNDIEKMNENLITDKYHIFYFHSFFLYYF